MKKILIFRETVSHWFVGWCREMKEESGVNVTVANLDEVGVLLFEFVDNPQIWEVHIFRTTHFSGEITETDGTTFLEKNCLFFSFFHPIFPHLHRDRDEASVV